MKKMAKLIIYSLLVLNITLITRLVLQHKAYENYLENRIVQEVSIELTDYSTIKDKIYLEGYKDVNYLYTEDYSDLYDGSCGPVAIGNMLILLNNSQKEKFLRNNMISYLEVKDIGTKLKTRKVGGTNTANIIEGTDEILKENYDLNMELEFMAVDLWKDLKNEIKQGRPVFLASAERSLEHAYVVIGCAEIDGVKSVITMTGWKNSKYRVMGINQKEQLYYKVKENR